jgi:hypothetical protein
VLELRNVVFLFLLHRLVHRPSGISALLDHPLCFLYQIEPPFARVQHPFEDLDRHRIATLAFARAKNLLLHPKVLVFIEQLNRHDVMVLVFIARWVRNEVRFDGHAQPLCMKLHHLLRRVRFEKGVVERHSRQLGMVQG